MDGYFSKRANTDAQGLNVYFQDMEHEGLTGEECGSYFGAVVRGDNVIGRPWNYVWAHPRNREAFLEVLRAISRSGELLEQQEKSIAVKYLTLRDWHELMLCVFPNMPFQVLEDAILCHRKDAKPEGTIVRCSSKELVDAFSKYVKISK